MPTTTFGKSWEVANNAGFSDFISFFVGSQATIDPLDAYTGQMILQQQGRPKSEAKVYTTTDLVPYITLISNVLAWDIPDTVTLGNGDTIAGWAPGTYDVQFRVFGNGEDVDRYNLLGPGRVTLIRAPGT